MITSKEILDNYYGMVEDYKLKAKDIRNSAGYNDYSDEWKEKQVKEISSKILAEQKNYRDKYELRLKNELIELKNKVSTDIPDILTQGLNFTEQELQFLADKYEDDYFSSKVILDIAIENDYAVKVNAKDYVKEVSRVKEELQNIDDKFSNDPFRDTPTARLRTAMGLDFE